MPYISERKHVSTFTLNYMQHMLLAWVHRTMCSIPTMEHNVLNESRLRGHIRTGFISSYAIIQNKADEINPLSETSHTRTHNEAQIQTSAQTAQSRLIYTFCELHMKLV